MPEKTINVPLTESQIKNIADFIDLNLLETIRSNVGIDNLYYVLDMCEAYRMLREIEVQLKNKPEEESDPEEEKEPPEKLGGVPERTEGKRKKIDIGKVMALKAAGWSNAKIADEMGVQTQSIAAAVCNYKKSLKGAE